MTGVVMPAVRYVRPGRTAAVRYHTYASFTPLGPICHEVSVLGSTLIGSPFGHYRMRTMAFSLVRGRDASWGMYLPIC
jgi:hypothetical protein